MSLSAAHKRKNEQRLKRQKTCKHFNGVQNDACKVGVQYETVRVQGQGLPCLPMYQGPGCPSCAKIEFPTEAELDAEELAWQQSLDRTMKAMQAIKDHTKGLKGIKGQIICPMCSKRLAYSISGYNGHIWAKCETTDCVSFIQ